MGYAVWTPEGEHTGSYKCFLHIFQRVFDHPPEGKEMGERLFILKQGILSVAEYALSFHMLAAGSSWNETAIKDVHHLCCTTQITELIDSGAASIIVAFVIPSLF